MSDLELETPKKRIRVIQAMEAPLDRGKITIYRGVDARGATFFAFEIQDVDNTIKFCVNDQTANAMKQLLSTLAAGGDTSARSYDLEILTGNWEFVEVNPQ